MKYSLKKNSWSSRSYSKSCWKIKKLQNHLKNWWKPKQDDLKTENIGSRDGKSNWKLRKKYWASCLNSPLVPVEDFDEGHLGGQNSSF